MWAWGLAWEWAAGLGRGVGIHAAAGQDEAVAGGLQGAVGVDRILHHGGVVIDELVGPVAVSGLNSLDDVVELAVVGGEDVVLVGANADGSAGSSRWWAAC